MNEISFVSNQGIIHFTYKDVGLYGKYINQCRLDAWEQALNNYPISLEKVVDVGCSYGSWAENYRLLGFKYLYGIEPHSPTAEKAKLVFDEVDCGYASDLTGLHKTIAANGVIIHILEDEQEIKFLSDIGQHLTEDGHFLWSVVAAEIYHGGIEKIGPNSCSKFLNKHRLFAEKAGLNIVNEIGTFLPAPSSSSVSQYQSLIALADNSRKKSIAFFSEVLFVSKRGL